MKGPEDKTSGRFYFHMLIKISAHIIVFYMQILIEKLHINGKIKKLGKGPAVKYVNADYIS